MNKIKKYLALFVASLCLCLHAWAETFSVANTEGVFISYETTSETTVRVIKGESNYAGNVVIPSSVSYNEVEYTVDAIGEYAFFECPNLESVEIPNSVQTIGERAFENCSALSSVTIGESVTRIGYDAFKRSGLTSVVLPNSLEYIDYHAFDGCANLEYVSLGLSIQTIRENVFQGCDNLSTVNVGSISSLMNIEFTNSDSNPLTKAEHLYLNGEEVTELVIPDGVTEIPANFFSGLTGITSVVIPGSVIYIGDNAFSGCTSLASVTFPDSPFTLGQNVFANTAFLNNAEDGVIYVGNIVYGYQGSMPENASIVIKEGTTAIVENAFLNCTGLTSIEVPATVTYIGKNAFAGTTWYETQPDGPIYINKVFYKYKGTMALNSEYEVADGTVSISGEAFKGYTQLSKLVLPSSLTTIGEQAFHGCLGLADLSIGEGLTYTGNDAFGRCNNLNNIYVPNVAQLFFLSSGSGQSNPFALARHLFVNDEELTELVIPDGVEELNEGFFYNFDKNVTSVTIPNSVTKIGGSAFKDWTNLAQVTFGESLKTIGDWAFAGCSALTRIDLPNSLESIGGYAFRDCSNLSYITLGDSLKTIGDWAFNGCNSLNTVNIPKVDILFSDNSFAYNGNPFSKASTLHVNGEVVTELVIPYGVEELNEGFFYNFGKNVTSVTIPNSVKNIGYATFLGWTNLSQVTLGDSLKTIGTAAFQGCTALESIVIPNSVTSFARDVFHGCSNLASVTLGNSLQTIGGGSFWECTRLDSIIIPNSVTTIEDRVFEGCTKLSYITLGDSLKTIGDWAFNGCNSLNTVNIPKVDILFSDNSFAYNGNPFSKASTLHVNGKEVTELVIPDGVEELREGFFYNFGKNVTSVTIPNSVTKIGGSAFKDWTNLAQVTFGDSLKTIGDRAFNSCSSITRIDLPNSLESIGGYAFAGCSNLSYLTIGDSLKTIATGAFSRCDTVNISKVDFLFNDYSFGNTNPFSIASTLHVNGKEVTELVIPDGIDELSQGFFYNFAKNVTSVTIANSVKNIGDRAFRDWTNLSQVTFGESLKTIGIEAFWECMALESVVFPNSLDSIMARAFEGCSMLSSVTFGDSIVFVGESAFYRCENLQSIHVTNLDTWYAVNFENGSNPLYYAKHLYYNGEEVTQLVIPEGVTEVTKDLFKGYENIISVVLPNSVVKIDDYAFSNLANLQSVTLTNSLDTIGTGAFSGCTSLKSIEIPNSVRSLARDVFRYCSSLSSVTLSSSLKTIGGSSFCECTSLDSIVIPNSVTTIEDRVFEGCTKLSYITLGDSLKTIGDFAFENCDNLQKVEVADAAAYFAINFASASSNPARIAKCLYCDGKLVTEYIMPYGATVVGHNLIAGYEDFITSIKFANSVETIGDWVFNNNQSLTKITLPNSVKNINERAFGSCHNLRTIIWGDSVATVGYHAFYDCESIEEVYINSLANWLNIEFMDYHSNPITKAKQFYFDNENITELIIPDGCDKIPSYAFCGANGITSAIISNSVKSIGAESFRDCSSLSTITLGDSIRSFGFRVFQGCDSLTINVTKLETFFNDYSFGNEGNPFSIAKNLCVNDEPIPDVLVVPNTVEKIPGGVFNGRGIISLTIPNSVKVIGEKAFENCEKLTLVSFGNSVDSIGHRAFAKCNALESIELPNSLKTISSEAFLDCRSVSSLTLGNSLETIGERAFRDCRLLESISLPNTISRIGASAFENCDKVLTVTLGSRLKTIENSTFRYCRSLESITIPNSVKEISSEAFYDCDKLATVVLGDSIESIKQKAFGNIGNSNSESTKVYIPSLDWLFRVNIEEFLNDRLFRDIYIGQQPLTTITIPDNFTEAPILKLLYNSCISSLNTGNGLKTLPKGESRNITQVTLGSNVTKVEAEFPEAYIVLSNNATPPVITEKTFPKCMFDNGAEGVVVLLNANDQKAYSKAKVWEGMQMSNQSNQVAVQVSAPGSIGTDLALGLRMPVAKVVGLTVSGEINEQDIMQMNKNMMSLLYLDLSDAIVDKIPDDAFNGKQQLLSLVLPKTTKVVGNSAFKGCNGIEELQMPMDVTEIGDEAFTGTSIRSMDFNYALKKIGNRAFANTPLKEISFQNKVESIGNEAFYGCNLEQELLFSETLRSIGDRAFDGQRGISGHLTIPESVASVGEGAFRGTSISTVFISGKMTTLESSVFANCNLLDVVYIPDNITNINSSAFQNCSSLKNLRLSQNIEEIGSEAFRSIPIRSVNVPENAKTLKSYSFADCSNLRFVTLPSTMTSLEEGVFSGCRQLMNLTTKALTPPEVKPNTFRGVNTDKCVISMPTVSIEAYITAPYWGRFMEMRNDIAVETEGKGSISFVSGDTEEDDDAASARTTRAGNATETMEDDITLVDDGSSLYVPQNGVVRFHITPAEGETILSATFDGVDITSQIIDGVFVTTADKLSSKLEVNFSQVTKTSQLITWEQSFEPLMVGDKVALSATASSGLPVTFDFADENSKECASLSNNTLTITKSGVIAIIALQKGDDEYASVATEMKYIRAYEYGDANADMEINSADLATAVDYAIGNNPQEFLFKAADVNKDKKVNVADVAGVVDIVLNAPVKTAAFEKVAQSRDVYYGDILCSMLDGKKLNFSFVNEHNGYLTVQCDVRLKDGSMPKLDDLGNPVVSVSGNKHAAQARLLEDDYVRILVYSLDNTPMIGNFTLTMQLEESMHESDIELWNAGYSVRIDDNIAYRSFNYGSVTALENLQDTFSNMDIKVNGNVLSFYSSVDCLLPIASINGMCHMLNVKVGFNEFVLNQGVYIIGKKKIIIK